IAVDRGWVGQAPMRGHWLSRPVRAHLPRRVVADRKHEIERWRTRGRELIPALAAQSSCGKIHVLEQFSGYWMHRALRMTAGTVAPEAAAPPMVNQRFGQDAPGRIAGAKKKHVINSLGHCYPVSEGFCPYRLPFPGTGIGTRRSA